MKMGCRQLSNRQMGPSIFVGDYGRMRHTIGVFSLQYWLALFLMLIHGSIQKEIALHKKSKKVLYKNGAPSLGLCLQKGEKLCRSGRFNQWICSGVPIRMDTIIVKEMNRRWVMYSSSIEVYVPNTEIVLC